MKERLFGRGKKCLSVLLAALMVFTLVSTGAAESYSTEDITFNEESLIEESLVEENSDEVQLDEETDTLGSISGSMWIDSNTDGLWGDDEYGASGLTVSLYAEGEEIATAVTEPNGAYNFESLEAGEYKVAVSEQTIDENEYLVPLKSIQEGEDNKLDANWDADSEIAESEAIVLNDGEAFEGVDGGMRTKMAIMPAASATVTTAAQLKAAIESKKSPIYVTQSFTLNECIVVDAEYGDIEIIGSNGVTITRSTSNTKYWSSSGYSHRHFYVTDRSALVLKNITLAGTGLKNGYYFNGGVASGRNGTIRLATGATVTKCYNDYGAVSSGGGLIELYGGVVSYNYSPGHVAEGAAGVYYHAIPEGATQPLTAIAGKVGVYMTGGSIIANESAGTRGAAGLYVYGEIRKFGRSIAQVILSGGSINSNSAQGSYGNIVNVSYMDFLMSGSSTMISYNTSHSGTFVYGYDDYKATQAAQFSITGGEFYKNRITGTTMNDRYSGSGTISIMMKSALSCFGQHPSYTPKISNTTISDNTTALNGGAIYLDNVCPDCGNAVFAELEIRNSTITNNTASKNGGAIYSVDYDYSNPASTSKYRGLKIVSSTFSGNKAYKGFTPPTNSSSFDSRFSGSLLNNNDINYTGAAKTYTVSYNANGGIGAPSSQAKEHGVSLTLRTAKPSRSGYTFQGWGTSSTTSTVSYAAGGTYSNDASITLYAVWKSTAKYTVYYNANGGTGAPASQTKEHGVILTLSSTKPTWTEHTFMGWSTSPTGTTASYQPLALYHADSSITLYAIWRADTTYTRRYDANGGIGAPASQSHGYGEGITIPWQEPTRTGYTFQGWSESNTATYPSYYPGDYAVFYKSGTFYAVWKAHTYTVSYNANGGTGAPASQTKTHDVPLTLSNTVPTRSEYTFQGWATSKTATTATYAAGDAFAVNANTTLYAVWKLNVYKITYNGNGATTGVPAEQNVNSGSSVSLSLGSSMVRAGYLFVGWTVDKKSADIDKTGSEPAGLIKGGTAYSPKKDVTLYAVWAEDSDGDKEADYLQRKVIYNPGAMNGTQVIVLLEKGQKSFVTIVCPASWSNSVDVFDGWEKKDGTVIESAKGIYFEPDETDGKVMTLTAVVNSWKTAVSIETIITDPEKQVYLADDPFHYDGVTVIVKYRDGTTEVYDTPAKITGGNIVLKTENGKGKGTSLKPEDNGQHLVATKKQPDNTILTSEPSVGVIAVGNSKREITLVVVGGDTYTKDILSVSDSKNNILASTLNTVTTSGINGEVHTVRQSASLDKSKYELAGFYINGEDFTSEFIDGSYSFMLVEDTIVYAVYNHDAAANEYNVYANVLSGVETGTIQARRTTGNYVNAPSSSVMQHISYDNDFTPVKMVAEGLEADAQHIAVALLPEDGYHIGSVVLNGEFLTSSHELWKTDGYGNVVIILPKDDEGNIIDKTSYYLTVSYIKDTSTENYSVTMTPKSIKGGVEVPGTGTGNEIILAEGEYSETGYTMSYPVGTMVKFGARAGKDYIITEVKLDGKNMALSEGDYFFTMAPINEDHEIEVTFVHKSDFAKTIDVLETEPSIVRGHWADEQEGYASFWVSINDEAVDPDDMSMFEISAAPALLWKDAGVTFHEMLSTVPTLTGETKTVDGKVYSEMKIPVEVRKSGVTAIELKTEDGTLATAYVLTPGNTAAAFATLDAADVTNAVRVVNGTKPIPGKGLENNFIFEMMDMNKDKGINSSDITNMIRIINGQQHYYVN